jgi:hypothetical protein
MAFGDVLSVGVPTDGSVNTSQLANSAVTDAKIVGMSSSKLTGALPAIDGSALTSVGKIKQIVSNNIDTQLEVGSGATPDWSAAETTITPTSNTNPILVMINTYIKNTTSATRGNAQLRRKTNNGGFGNIGGAYYIYSDFSNLPAAGYQFYHQRWDNPTRSAGDSLTYTIQLSRSTGSDSIFLIGDSNHPANITLIEFEGTTEDDGV